MRPHDYDLLIIFIMSSVIAVFGFIGNTLTFIGFHRHSKKTATSFLFKALSVADNLVLVSTLLYLFLKTILTFVLTAESEYDLELRIFAAHVTLYMYYIRNICILGVICTTILLAVTRVIAVYFPIHVSRICSIPKVRVSLILNWKNAEDK